MIGMYFENLIALHIAIDYQVPVEVAFEMLDRMIENKKTKFVYKWSNEDREDMLKLKAEGLTWQEIGKIYGKDRCNILRTANTRISGVDRYFILKKS